MAAIKTLGSAAASAVFGCTAESGLIVQSFSRQVSREKAEVLDHDGNMVSVSYYKPHASISISGFANGSFASTGVGNQLTIAASTSEGGISAGKILIDSISFSQSSEGFKEIAVEATQYPSL
jgi:hypothetical protein